MCRRRRSTRCSPRAAWPSIVVSAVRAPVQYVPFTAESRSTRRSGHAHRTDLPGGYLAVALNVDAGFGPAESRAHRATGDAGAASQSVGRRATRRVARGWVRAALGTALLVGLTNAAAIASARRSSIRASASRCACRCRSRCNRTRKSAASRSGPAATTFRPSSTRAATSSARAGRTRIEITSAQPVNRTGDRSRRIGRLLVTGRRANSRCCSIRPTRRHRQRRVPLASRSVWSLRCPVASHRLRRVVRAPRVAHRRRVVVRRAHHARRADAAEADAARASAGAFRRSGHAAARDAPCHSPPRPPRRPHRRPPRRRGGIA